jgi:(p)ppGpp synthase/HD superfamily hydrolase
MYAQSNVQLFSQMKKEGYLERELGCVLRTYELAVHLFTGRFQPSGNTFLSHAVCTASILTSLKTSAEVLSAGLIHSVYRQGEFGDGRETISNYKRKFVRRAVGEKVEDYVFNYRALHWNLKTIPEVAYRICADDYIDHDIVLMKLSNELEHFLDFEILYYGDIEKQRVLQQGDVMCEIANKLGYPNFASQLEKLMDRAKSREIPNEIQKITGQSRPFEIINTKGDHESVIVFPRSGSRKMVVSLFQLYRQSRYFIKHRCPMLIKLYRMLCSALDGKIRKNK